MIWVPTLKALVGNEAVPPVTDELPRVVLPSENVTVPVAVLADAIVAVRVTLPPLAVLIDDDAKDVVVFAFAPLFPLLLFDPHPMPKLTIQSTARVPTGFM